ncbi:MAG: DUF1801 domain-containing protein [Anaerolineales bacterium]|nr:DUF1801 domain-containing protein [Anaerolineales bacterium]
MNPKAPGFSTFDEYIAIFPPQVQERLQALRAVIRAAAPQAVEKISYQMPTYYLNGNLVHFAAHARHIGFYPAPTGVAAFKEQLAVYKNSKGAVQFPLDQPLPLELVRRIVEYRVEENLTKGSKKATKQQREARGR